jgi:ribosomal protein S18 acetylase RimI-like enzyme
MLLFTPSHVPADIIDTVIRPLVERVLEHFRGRAIDLAQALLDPAERKAIRLFEQCGFERLAELIYLDREVRKAHDAALPAGLSWAEYSDRTHAEFAATISRSYAGSLDCPSLNGRRDVQDVIAGHKAAGEFDPKLWFVLREGTAARGVLLLNRSPRTDAVELVYLGLAPEARGRGLGDLMMKHALAVTALVGARRLTLAVDSRNKPALKLYHRSGLSRVCSRVALLRDLRGVRLTGEALPR